MKAKILKKRSGTRYFTEIQGKIFRFKDNKMEIFLRKKWVGSIRDINGYSNELLLPIDWKEISFLNAKQIKPEIF